MGSWNETCAITRLPIDHGEPCVMVLFHRKFFDKKISESLFCAPSDLRKCYMFIKGTYNDYGWIEEIEEEIRYDRDTQLCIFFRLPVWDMASKTRCVRFPDRSLFKLYKDEFTGPGCFPMQVVERGATFEEFCNVVDFASYARINLMAGLALQGTQDAYGEERPYGLLLNLTRKELAAIKKRRTREMD